MALALILAYGALVSLSNSGVETAAQGYWRKNRNVIAAYAAMETRPVVFAGSSLTAAVRFPGFDACAYNMGLIGESALTGMDVIHGAARMPKTVFIEINFPERESNASLIHSADGWLVKRFPNVVYVPPITYLVQFGRRILQRLREAPAAGAVGALPASNSEVGKAREAELVIQLEVFETKLAKSVLKNKLAEFAIKIRELQKNGVRVVLLELPVHPDLEMMPRARQIREAFQQAFPELHMVGAAQLAQGVVIKTADGLHLTEEDSNGVLRNFLPELRAECGQSIPSSSRP